MFERLMILIKSHRHQLIIFAVAIVITALLWWPLGTTINSVDATFHIGRYVGLDEGLLNWQLNPYGDFGGGAATTLFYGPFQALIVVFLHFIIPNWALAINSMLLVAVFLAGYFMYRFVREFSHNSTAALFSSILYMTTPYLIYELILMQDHPTVVAFALLPLIFTGLYRVINRRRGGVILLGISSALLLMTHLLSMFQAVLCVGLLLIFNIRRLNNWLVWRQLILAAIISIGLSAIFWLPFLELHQVGIYAVFDLNFPMQPWRTADGMNNFTFNYLTPWIGGNAKLCLMFMATIGLMIFLWIFARCRKIKISRTYETILKNSITIVIIGAILISSFIDWRIMPSVFYNLQFPYRFLLIIGFFASLILGYSVAKLFKFARKFGKIVLVVFVGAFLFLLPIFYLSTYATKDLAHSSVDEAAAKFGAVREYLPEKAEQIPRKIECSAQCSDYYKNKNSIQFKIDTKEEVAVFLPLNYYPGYVASLKGRELPVKVSQFGGVEIIVPANSRGWITVSFRGTSAKIVGIIITSITFVSLITFGVSRIPTPRLSAKRFAKKF